MSVRYLHHQRHFTIQLHIVDDIREIPSEFFREQQDSDFLIGKHLVDFCLQLLLFMDYRTFHPSQPHAGIGINVIADKIHFHYSLPRIMKAMIRP